MLVAVVLSGALGLSSPHLAALIVTVVVGAGLILHGNSGEVSLSAGVAKTVAQLLAAAQHRVKVLGISIYFKGTSATDTPAKVRIVRQTTAGTMSAGTLYKNDENAGETIQTTFTQNASAEPTITDVLDVLEIHPQTGMKVFYPLGQEIVIKGGNRLGIEITAAQGQTVSATVDIEE